MITVVFLSGMSHYGGPLKMTLQKHLLLERKEERKKHDQAKTQQKNRSVPERKEGKTGDLTKTNWNYSLILMYWKNNGSLYKTIRYISIYSATMYWRYIPFMEVRQLSVINPAIIAMFTYGNILCINIVIYWTIYELIYYSYIISHMM